MKLNTNKIKKEMVKRRLNISDLAKLMGISRQRLSYILSDKYKSNFATITKKFAKVLRFGEKDLLK